MRHKQLPSSAQALAHAFRDCERKQVLKVVEKSSFQDYVVRSQKDLASAENDFLHEDYYWVRIKGYHALFHILNALLVKHLGYYSKDHGCLLIALLKNNILSDAVAKKLHLVAGDFTQKEIENHEDALQDIDDLHIQRNFALYKPKAWEDVTKDDIAQELEKIKHNIRLLVELL